MKPTSCNADQQVNAEGPMSRFIHEFSADIDPAAAHAIARNDRPRHVFADCHSENFQANKANWCYLHGGLCPLPESMSLDLYIAGFVCKANSIMNQDRFQKDPTESHHFESFESCVRVIKSLRPATVVLENVAGILMKCSKGKSDSVLDRVMGELNSIKGYVWKYAQVETWVLPTVRPRVYFFGTRLGADALQQISTNLEKLVVYCQSRPRHHLESFLLQNADASPYAMDTSEPKWSEQDKADHHAAYATALATARKRASGRSTGAIEKTAKVSADAKESESLHLRCATPWIHAQIDVYDAITKKMVEDDPPLRDALHRVADAPWPRLKFPNTALPIAST